MTEEGITKKEIINRLNKIIDLAMDLAIDLEFGDWENFENHIRETYTNIPIPDVIKKSRKSSGDNILCN